MRRERSQAKRTGRLLCLCAASLVACASPASHAAVHAQRRQPSPQQSQPSAQRRQEAERLVAEGVAALDRGERDAARESFRRALDSDPSNVTAHTYLGVIADQSGDLASAERHFAAAAIAAPLLPSARNNHGAVLLRLGRTNEAAKQFEVSLRLARNQPSALFNLAQIRFNSGTPEGFRAAFELFGRANQLAPDAETARSLVATALQLNDRDAAARYFKQYASSLPGASGSVSEPAARAELGLALLENGLHEEAAAELGAAVAGDPAKPAWVVPLARAHLARNDIRAAGRALESSVARGAADATVYALLAEVYERSGHVENAIPAMRLAIERDPKSEAYRFRYAMLLTDTRAPAAAVIRLQEALREFPRSSRLWFALGVAQTALDKVNEAAEAFQQARALDPKFAPAAAYLGMTYDQLGRFPEAVALYEEALALDDTLAAAHYLAAETILKQTAADTARAESHLRRAVALDSKFAPARISLAKLYLRNDRVEEAARELESAVALDPGSAEAHYHLGRALRRLKRTAEAEAALATFKRLSEEKRERAQAEPRDIMRRLANVRF
ncbi:MAG TPA: tetratricopeptide repeat protein [Pyrinomonadaceae bacterium]|nr:tetratricopeptide repeat protein [Pyrinomonadaceae bacterium]